LVHETHSRVQSTLHKVTILGAKLLAQLKKF
jgi:hypothetical protein